MINLGIFVGENDWTFFNDIYDELSRRYHTHVFQRKTYAVPILHGRLNRWRYSRDIQNLLNNADVCFFEWSSDLLAVASFMPKKCKIIARLHSFELLDWAPKINWDSVDRLIVLSDSIRLMFSELYSAHAHKVIVIHNGCSLIRFKSSPEKEFDFTLGMLGSIAPIKRVYEVMLMLSILVEKGYPAKLRIAGNPYGDDRYAVAIHRQMQRLGLQGHIFFDGFVKDTPGWLQKIDVFISNSYWEGQQTSLIEALASGCYCLSHSWNGVAEMLPPENIYLLEAELMEKIIAYSNLPGGRKNELRSQMRLQAEKKFDIESTKEKIAGLIEQEATHSTLS